MPRIITGERIGRQGRLRVCCVAAIYDAGRILLTRRSDDGKWCFPGGAMDPGESATEACERETLEETGLIVRVKRLIGIYSTPDYICEYEDGNRWHTVELFFEAETVGGALTATEEATEVKFFSQADAAALSMHLPDRERLADAFGDAAAPLIR